MIPKFRAFLKSTKDIREVLVIDYLNRMVDLEGGEIEQYFEDVILMQYTGLKDKSGVEIFEGDIVAYDDYEFSYTAIVKKETYYFWLKGIEPDDAFHLEDISDEYDGTTDLTVIGNIYEN